MPVVRTLLLLTILFSVFASPGYAFTFKKQQDPVAESANSARFILSPDIKLIEIDGEKYDSKFLNTGNTELSLPPGYHEFRIRYDKIWDLDYDNFDPLQSDAVVVAIAAESANTYQITHKPLNTYKQAKQFTFEPEFFVVDIRNQKRTSSNQEQELLTNRTMQDPQKPGNVDKAPATKPGPVPAPSAKPVAASAAVVDTQGSAPVASQPQSLIMLQYWWKRASVKDRKQFYQWIGSTGSR